MWSFKKQVLQKNWYCCRLYRGGTVSIGDASIEVVPRLGTYQSRMRNQSAQKQQIYPSELILFVI